MARKEVTNLLHKNGEAMQLDDLDMKITNELLDDAETSSSDMARKYSKPLSTIQRRRTRLERSILKKSYDIDTDYANWRSGEIFLKVGGGKTEDVARQLFETYDENISLVSTTMNNVGNLMAHIFYTSSPEMFSVIEVLKKMEHVEEVIYAEHIQKIGERKPRFILKNLKKNNSGRK